MKISSNLNIQMSIKHLLLQVKKQYININYGTTNNVLDSYLNKFSVEKKTIDKFVGQQCIIRND